MDITPSTSSSTPEQAASNIQAANIFSINPTDNKGINDDLVEKSKQLTGPTQAEPPVQSYRAQSSEHAALADPDVPKLNYVSRVAKYFGDKINGDFTAGEKVSGLAFKQMMQGGKLSDEDEGNLFQANQDQKSLASRNYDLTGWEKAPADIAAGIVNQGQSAVRGTLEAIQKMPRSPVLSALYGVGATFYKNVIGATYNELSHATKDDGTPVNMDETTKRNIALGVGAVHGAINAVLPEVAGRMAPFLNTTITPKFVSMAMQAPENAVMRMALNNIGHSTVMMGAMGVGGEATNLVKEEMEKNYDGTHASLMNALVTASQKVATNKDKYAERLAAAGGESALTGAIFGLGGNIVGKGSMRSQIDAVAAQGRDFINNLDITYNRPAGLIEGEAPPRPESKPGQPPPETPPSRGPMKDVTPIRPEVGDEVPVDHTVKQAGDSLQFHEGLHTINDVMNSTQMSSLAPEESASVMKRIFDGAGISKLYTTLSNARMFSRDEESGRAMRNIIDPSGKLAGQMNAPIPVDPAKVMEVAKTHPEILDHFSASPEAPNPLQAKTHLENLQEAEQRRTDVLSSLGLEPKDVAPESNVAKLPRVSTEEPIPYDLEADAHRTQQLIDEKRQIQSQLDQIDPKKAKEVYDDHQSEIAKINKEIEEIKSRVVDNFSKPPPGKLLFGHWPEAGLQESKNAMSGYLHSPTFTEAIRQALPKAEVDRFNDAQLRARADRATNIVDAAKYEMDKVHDVHAEEIKELRYQQELARIANDPNYGIVDKFRNSKNVETKKSIYQIDPKSLSKDQLQYADHYRMKEHGVFAKKGGMPADSAAQLLGVKDGNELLKILSQTPTREQIARARSDANLAADAKELRSQDDLNHTKIVEALRDTAKNHLEEMKFMKDQEWPATKSGIKRIALPLPKIEALEEKARQMVSQMKVGELNGYQYQIGEARSNRAAVNAILKNEVESAFQFKESAALNSLIRKEIMVQTGLANRSFAFFRKVNRPATQQLLHDAGKLYYEAMQELQDLWKLSPSKAGQAEVGSFRKWLKKEVESGRGDFSIPERLSDLRQSANDMTVEQLQVVSDRGRVILNEAKFKNKLIGLQDTREEEAHKGDIERLEAQIVEKIKARRGSDISRIQPPSGPIDYAWRKFKGSLSTMEAGLVGKQNVYRELDDGKTGGFFHETFNEMIEGSGKYLDKKGFTYVSKKSAELESWLSEAKKLNSEVDQWEKIWFDIPEFQGIKELKYGKMTKGDLAKAYAYRGQQYTKDLLTSNNGGVSDETWTQIHDRYLSKKDVDFIHTVIDHYRDYRPEIEAQQKRDGRDVTFIEGIPVTHQGTTRVGGWVRARYEREFTRGAAEQLKDFLDNKDSIQDEKKQGASYGRQWASETTHQGYLVERKGSNMPLDLNFRGLFDGFHEIIHDLAYRDPIRNFMELMSRPNVYDSLVEGVGKPKADFLIENNIKLADQPSQRSDGYFKNFNNFLKDGYRRFGRKYAITALWGNSGTVIKQTESLAEMFNHMGPKGLYHFAKTNAMMVRNMDKLGSFFEIAERLDPNMRKYFSGVEDTAASTIEGLIPRKNFVPKKFDWLANAGHMAETVGFTPIMMTDYYLKGLQAMTHLSMALDGAHPDINYDEFSKLSDKDQMDKIQSIVQQSSTLTQIQSRPELQAAAQDNIAVKPFIMFWNYQRNILNNTLLDARRSKWKSEDAWEKFQQSDYGGAGKDFGSASGIILGRMVWAFVGLSITKYAAGKTWDFAKKGINNVDDLAEAGFDYMKHMMTAPLEQIADTIPGESAIKWGIDHKRKYQMVEVNNPLTQAMSSVGTCYDSLGNLLTLSRHMNRMQTRACLQAESYIAQPLPINGFYKAMKWYSSPSQENNSILSTKNVDNLVEQIKHYVSNPPSNVDPKAVESLDKLGKSIKSETADIPKGTADNIKLAMSGGDWSKPNGMYGFSKDQWSQLQKSAPELGLTDAGRISKDTAQQEKAIDWSLRENAQKLTGEDIPVNQNTLFGVQKMGFDNYDKLFKASADAKLKTVFGNEFLEKNPEIGQFKTVGQVKQHLNSILEQARKAHSVTANLTPPTNNAED